MDMKPIRVAFIGGLWSRNIGNAFYNLGTMAFLEGFGSLTPFFIPDPPQWEAEATGDFDLIGNLAVDLVILTGPCLNMRLESVYRRTFQKLHERSIKIGFLSAGMSLYDTGEAREVARFLNEFPPAFVFTRDHVTFMLLNSRINAAFHDGICMSMFLNEAVSVPALGTDDYYVFNFDGEHEPVVKLLDAASYQVYFPKRRMFRPLQLDISGTPIIRSDNRSIMDGYKSIYNRPSVYHSDLPHGYLALLKSAKAVFSERVHTCAATLVFGGQAQFVPRSSRSFEHRHYLFDRIGVTEIRNMPTRLDQERIANERDAMRKAFGEVIAQLKG